MKFLVLALIVASSGFAQARGTTIVNCRPLNGHRMSMVLTSQGPAVAVDSVIMATVIPSDSDERMPPSGPIEFKFVGGYKFNGYVDPDLYLITRGVLTGPPNIRLDCVAPGR